MTQPRPARGDEGFTLVEVVVAVVLLGLVTAAVLPFFVQSLDKSSELQHRQAAVALASSAMEQARSVVATAADLGDDTSPAVLTALVRGRAQADVVAQWAAVGEPTTDTTPRWDPRPGTAPLNPRVSAPDPATRAVLPLQRTDTVSSLTYTSQVLIGTCRRPRTSPTAPCTATTAALAPTDVELVRLVVVTRWSPLAGGCPAQGCTYRLVSLVDPTPDPQWVVGVGKVRPDGVDGSVRVKPGQTVTVDVLANDSVIRDGRPFPVTLRGTIPPGASADAAGRVVYAAPASATTGATVVVAYSVRNSAGSETGQTTLTITVVP